MITKVKSGSDNRYFIWTIVFLLVSGVSLVSYIMISDINQSTELQTAEILVRK